MITQVLFFASLISFIITLALTFKRKPAEDECPSCGATVQLSDKECVRGARLIIPPHCIKCGHRIDYTEGRCRGCNLRTFISQFVSYFSGIAGIIYLISALILFFKWNPFVEIGLAIVIVFLLNLYRKNRRGFKFVDIVGWRMWYVYSGIFWLLIALVIKLRQGG